MTQLRLVRRLVLSLGLALLTLALVLPVTQAGLDPASATYTVRPGGTITETKKLIIPTILPKADILLAFDTTGSMGNTITAAKQEAQNIVDTIRKEPDTDTRFAVAQFRDYDLDPLYKLEQPLIDNSQVISNAIGKLEASQTSSQDDPEAYNTLFFKSVSDSTIGWRAEARKLVMVFGDAAPHRGVDPKDTLANQGFPACGLNYENTDNVKQENLLAKDVLAGMRQNKLSLVMVLQPGQATSSTVDCYDQLAKAAYPGGRGVEGKVATSAALAKQIEDEIKKAFSTVGLVELKVKEIPNGAKADWITLPAPLQNVQAGSEHELQLKATVAADAKPGSYTFKIQALADGLEIGEQTLTLVVPEKKLALTPESAVLPTGGNHTVTARLFDSLGPLSGESVDFVVSAGPDAGVTGSGLSDTKGEVSFSFTNSPPQFGTDTIVATSGKLGATANVVWEKMGPQAQLRFAHLAPTTANVDIYVNRLPVLKNVNFSTVSPYLPFAPGNYAIDVIPAGATLGSVNPLISKGIDLWDDEVYTFSVLNFHEDTSSYSYFYRDDPQAPASGTAKLKVLHASPDADALEVVVKAGPTVAEHLNNGESSDYLELSSGSYTLEVRSAESGEVLYSSPVLDLKEGKNYTLIAEGKRDGSPTFKAILIRDRQF